MVRAGSAVDARHITTINEQNWRDLLTGEWLVKFYAPWCPACKAMSPAWKNVARWCRKESMLERDVRVADVDVTKNPGLTGRFMVTSLPTIFHAKDGTFRTYTGLREEHDFNTFLEEEKYLQLQPLPWYWAPDSFPMECLSFFFKIAVIVRDVHNAITTTYGLPVWVSYILFAVSTIVAGFALALLLVLLCDRVLSSRASPQPPLGSYTCPNVTADDGMDDASDIVEDDLPTPSGDTTDDSRMSGGDFPRPSSTRRRH
ncbi:Thioredoxin-related transmembrane protein 1 [Lamellibrachia satsuma]|nr:Thioredoxin-related transmembrane protein 1 [Lamellibrachia satsuma]